MSQFATPSSKKTGAVIQDWRPEDSAFWQERGQRIASRNLWISIPCLLLAFCVWMLFSAVAVNLNKVGFNFTTDQLFLLTALPSVSGAILRVPYSFVIPIFGGRRWTAISTCFLLIPCLWLGFAVQDSSTPFSVFVVISLLCGFAGANFASSMANISFFFPRERKGSALGVNAGLGNLGVSVVQFLSPLVVTAGIFGVFGGASQTIVKNGLIAQVWIQNAAFVWVPWIVIAAIAAWFGMNDLADAKASFAAQAAIFRRKDNWLMCVLYLGTFGSFIGYAAGFPLLIKSQFPGINALAYAWLGPLIGASIRPFGGWLADKLGGAPVTFWNFVVMACAVGGVLYFLPSGPSGGSFAGFFVSFLVLFMTSGIGNGSTFRMIPVIFQTLKLREVNASDREAVLHATKEGNTEAAATLGFSAAIAAYGGFFIPKSYGTSLALTGGPEAALYVFIGFYAICIAVTWWRYARRNAPMPC